MGVQERLLARAIDLRKAYKQLPLDSASLPHACICVYCPQTGKPEIYMGRVLPFGSRAAVVAFRRTSRAAVPKARRDDAGAVPVRREGEFEPAASAARTHNEAIAEAGLMASVVPQ